MSKEDRRLTDKRLKYQNEYLSKLKKEDRPAALWSIGEYLYSETEKYESKVRELDPKWDWGKPIKKEIINQVFAKKLDVSV